MLIRSQDKTILVNVDNVFNIAIRDINGATAIYVGSLSSCCIIAEYSTKAKAIKVLDMIQKVYEESQLPVIISALLFTDASAVDELKKELSNEKLKNRFVFQMPADNEVEV